MTASKAVNTANDERYAMERDVDSKARRKRRNSGGCKEKAGETPDCGRSAEIGGAPCGRKFSRRRGAYPCMHVSVIGALEREGEAGEMQRG